MKTPPVRRHVLASWDMQSQLARTMSDNSSLLHKAPVMRKHPIICKHWGHMCEVALEHERADLPYLSDEERVTRGWEAAERMHGAPAHPLDAHRRVRARRRHRR